MNSTKARLKNFKVIAHIRLDNVIVVLSILLSFPFVNWYDSFTLSEFNISWIAIAMLYSFSSYFLSTHLRLVKDYLADNYNGNYKKEPGYIKYLKSNKDFSYLSAFSYILIVSYLLNNHYTFDLLQGIIIATGIILYPWIVKIK